MDPDANDNNKKVYTSFVADHMEAVIYIEHGVVVHTGGMKGQFRRHIGSEVRRR